MATFSQIRSLLVIKAAELSVPFPEPEPPATSIRTPGLLSAHSGGLFDASRVQAARSLLKLASRKALSILQTFLVRSGSTRLA